MSAAIPTIGEPRVVYNRPVYMPEWTPAFEEAQLDTEVRHNGKPMGFRIRDMLPERRWAVLPSGDVLPQRDFEDKYQKWAERTVSGSRIIPISADNPYFDAKLIPVPLVERFVSTTLDFGGREVPIGFDPNKPPSKGAVVVPVGDGREINPKHPADAKMAQLAMIADLKQRGVLDAEQASSEMAKLLLEPQPVPAPPPGFSPVEPPAEVTVLAEQDETVVHAARCGYAAKSPAGRAAHERSCDDCKATPAVEGDE